MVSAQMKVDALWQAKLEDLGTSWVHKVGHVAARCHTLRCFTCGGVGHKAQVCASRRRQSMRSFSYLSARKVYESWKKNDTGSFEVQRRNDLSQGRSKVWMKKNILLNLNKVDDQCTKESGCHMASQTWGLSKTLMHLEFMKFDEELKGEKRAINGSSTDWGQVQGSWHADRGSKSSLQESHEMRDSSRG